MNKIAINNPSDIDATASSMIVDPVETFGSSLKNMHSIDRSTLEKIQLAALQKRFAQHRDTIPMLKKLADEQKVEHMDKLNDVVPLLFRHTVYKSYPSILLEKNRFTELTRWLNKLTSLDLSGVDVSHCQGIDSWIDTLDEKTELRIRHSSGTTGTVSFMPRSEGETDPHLLRSLFSSFNFLGLPHPTREKPFSIHVINGTYRSGYRGQPRNNDYCVKYLCDGDESKFHSLYPGRESADLMYLAGRLKAAQMKGEVLELSPTLLARKQEFEESQKKRPQEQEAFYADLAQNLRGEQIYMVGTWNVIFNVAAAGLKAGVENVFAPNSVVTMGGGMKGQVLPDDWEDQIKRFIGIEKIVHFYGMTEMYAQNKLCDHGRYHLEPTVIFFVLDPDTGEALPREGVQTGRAAFYDLLTNTMWGGFVTGDEVTIDWSSTCSCGQLSPHIGRNVERYSDKRGGDDKISCAAAGDAHDAALNYLVEFDG